MPFLRFHEPPVAVAADYHPPNGFATVQFDRELQAAFFDGLIWMLTHSAGSVAAFFGFTTGDLVVVSFPDGLDPLTIAYSPPPMQVVSVEGASADGFSGLPVEIV